MKHDICYIDGFYAKSDCDKLFSVRISHVESLGYFPNKVFIGDDELNRRCQHIIGDIKHYLMTTWIVDYNRFNDSDDIISYIPNVIDQVVLTGFAVVAWPVLSINSLISRYPEGGDRCVLDKEFSGDPDFLKYKLTRDVVVK